MIFSRSARVRARRAQESPGPPEGSHRKHTVYKLAGALNVSLEELTGRAGAILGYEMRRKLGRM